MNAFKRFFIFTFIMTAQLTALPASSNTSILDDPERYGPDKARDITSKPLDIIKFAEIREDMHVLDLFAGDGYYSEILSKIVGSQGKVILHNNKAYLSYIEQELQKRMNRGNFVNLVQYVHEANDLLLHDESLDSIFYVMGYHDLYHKADGWDVDKDLLFKQLYKALKPGGTLLVIDHSAPIGTGFTYSQTKHRIAPELVLKELKSYGFRFSKQTDILANPGDDYELTPFDPKVFRKTDRFALLFTK